MGAVVLPAKSVECGWRSTNITQHKDTSAFLGRAAAGVAGGRRPDLVLRWAALLRDIGLATPPSPRPDGWVASITRSEVGARWCASECEATVFKQMIDDVSQLPPASADSRLRRWEMDRLCGAPAMSPTPGPTAAAAQVGARRLRDPQQAPGARCRPVRPAGKADRGLAAQEDLDRVRPDLDGNLDHGGARRPAGLKSGVALLEGAAARSAVVHRGGDSRLLSGGNHGEPLAWESRPEPVVEYCIAGDDGGARIWSRPFDVMTSTVTARLDAVAG